MTLFCQCNHGSIIKSVASKIQLSNKKMALQKTHTQIKLSEEYVRRRNMVSKLDL